MLCPLATRPASTTNRPLGARIGWGIFASPDDHYRYAQYRAGDYGSYGINAWVCNPPAGEEYPGVDGIKEDSWRSCRVKGAAYIPLILDSTWFTNWPRRKDTPPAFNGERIEDIDMSLYCIERHGVGITHCTFVDFSVRRVALKRLWDLPWHRNWLTGGEPDGAYIHGPSDWPEWMKNFPEDIGG